MKTYCQALYMNVNETYINNFNLMKQAYNHYVHYLFAKVADKEKKEEGKHFRGEERKVLQTAQERVSLSLRFVSLFKKSKTHVVLLNPAERPTI
jgi:hypothetical protein